MGAAVIILGCAGMPRHWLNLEAGLVIRVIDPTQAAVSIAVGTILLK